ncbi:MAG: phospholipase D family protein [Candidatus Anstonellaceae archaeon]
MQAQIIHQCMQDEKQSRKIISHLEEFLDKAISFPGMLNWRAIVGHASTSGIELVEPLVWKALKQSQGAKIRFIIGMDYDRDSERSARCLWEMQSKMQWNFGKESFKVRLYFSKSKNEILHVKMHWIFAEGKSNEAHWVLVGSSNLSKGGLVKNSELAVCLQLSKKDREEIMQFQKIWERYRDSQNAVPLKKYVQSKVAYWAR